MTYNRLVSFDFFDTLVTRDCNNPEDIFDLIGKHVSDTDFKSKRISAQVLAFNSSLKNTIHLDDIYDHLDHPTYAKDQLCQIELQFELDSSLPISSIVQLYKRCIVDDKTLVAITSDMYLDSTFFLKCLHKHDIPAPDILLISCEVDEKKRDDAGIYNILLEKAEKSQISDVIHIGDNSVSDVENALKKNVRGLFFENKFYNGYLDKILFPSQDSIDFLDHSVLKSNSAFSNDIIDSLSVVARYCVDTIFAKSQLNDISHILFAARDGYILHALWDKLQFTEKHGCAAHYFPSSRSASIKCGISPESYEEFTDQFSSGIHGLLTSDLFTRLGLDCVSSDCLEYYGLQKKLTKHDVFFAKNISLIFKDNILSACAHQKNILTQYLSKLGCFKPESNNILLFEASDILNTH